MIRQVILDEQCTLIRTLKGQNYKNIGNNAEEKILVGVELKTGKNKLISSGRWKTKKQSYTYFSKTHFRNCLSNFTKTSA